MRILEDLCGEDVDDVGESEYGENVEDRPLGEGIKGDLTAIVAMICFTF